MNPSWRVSWCLLHHDSIACQRGTIVAPSSSDLVEHSLLVLLWLIILELLLIALKTSCLVLPVYIAQTLESIFSLFDALSCCWIRFNIRVWLNLYYLWLSINILDTVHSHEIICTRLTIVHCGLHPLVLTVCELITSSSWDSSIRCRKLQKVFEHRIIGKVYFCFICVSIKWRVATIVFLDEIFVSINLLNFIKFIVF